MTATAAKNTKNFKTFFIYAAHCYYNFTPILVFEQIILRQAQDKKARQISLPGQGLYSIKFRLLEPFSVRGLGGRLDRLLLSGADH